MSTADFPDPALTLTQMTIAVLMAIGVGVSLYWLAHRIGNEDLRDTWIAKAVKLAMVTAGVIVGVALLFFFAINRDKFE